MRAAGRIGARALVLALVLTSCGLAARGTVAVAPDLVTQPAEPVLPNVVVPVTTGFEPSVLIQKAATVPEPVILAKPTLPAADVGAMKHVWQSLNNCGPAAVVMALSTLGVDESQEVARLALRGEDVRRGMGPGPVGPWVQERFDLRMAWKNNGTNAVLKALVSNGFAPMVTQWMQDPWISRISHWRTVRGYDDARGVFLVNDPMLGRDVPLSYDWFGRNWQPFSYRYMVLYRPSDEPLLRAVIGAQWDDGTMRRSFYERMKAEAAAQGTSAAWLAFGEAAYQYGMFAEAVEAIEKGMALGSATGVFMIRSSLPNALRALGRFDEADIAQQRLSNLTPGVSPASSPTTSGAASTWRLDPAIAAVVEERQREDRARLEGARITD